jgi:hypothetical protein
MKTSVRLIRPAGLAVMLPRCVEDFVDQEDFKIHFKFAFGRQTGIETFKPGEYTVLAIPYSENFHTGIAGEPQSIFFRVTDDNGSTQATLICWSQCVSKSCC